MALRYVILSLVAGQPQSGYDIVKSFEHSVGHVWQASHQQVYRELGKLAKDSWLEFEREAQADKPDRKVYSITDLGMQSLHKWISGPIDSPAYRSPVLVRMLALPLVGAEPMIIAVREAKAEYEKKLKSYYAIEEQYGENKQQPNENGLQIPLNMALRMAIAFTEPMLVWCDETITVLEQYSASATSNAASQTPALETN